MYTILYIHFDCDSDVSEIRVQRCNTEHGLSEVLKKLKYDGKAEKQICVLEGMPKEVPIEIKFVPIKKENDNE